jgi:hypothetical protein
MTNIEVLCPPKFFSSEAKTPSKLATLNRPKPRYRRGARELNAKVFAAIGSKTHEVIFAPSGTC